jgi:2-iminobutanoate/2-iminopropanoate deaminase
MRRAALVLSLSLALAPAALRAQDRQVIRPLDAPVVGAYSPGIRTSNLVFASGQIGLAPGTRALVAGGLATETRQALENVERILQAAGTSLVKAVKCTVFLADINDFAAMNEVYRTFFPVDPPARTTVGVAGLPLGARVEIECIAAA